ncbi:hypothetical protein Sjap_002525 [Stephania japonica]|uniref:Uncharacterized protein n=1 Tax=Stephania japonica TaxID=461633 RepID=A0AAP0KMY7_9MAGN
MKRRESVGEEGEEEDQKLEIGEGFETNNNKIKIPVSAGVRRSLAIISVLPTPKPTSTYFHGDRARNPCAKRAIPIPTPLLAGFRAKFVATFM